MIWVKAWHIVFMVTWFAGLFYLPRLFVYHAEADDPISQQRFCVMERRLFVLMSIGGALTAVFGIWLLADYAWAAYAQSGWLHLKLALVALLILYHLHCGKFVRDFARDANRHSARFYRMFNEVPSLLLIAIILLAVAKPF